MFAILYICFWLGLAAILDEGVCSMTNVQMVGVLMLVVTGYIFTRRIWRHCGKCQ